MKNVSVNTAKENELVEAQRFYDSRGYGGAAIETTDIVVLAKHETEIVGIGRLCQEGSFLCLRGMQVRPEFQRQGLGSRILQQLTNAIGLNPCYCLPYQHLVTFYGQAGFKHVSTGLPTILGHRLSEYSARGLDVVAMFRNSQETV
ncbi:GNAT family N-acetyltransferase [Novilysobacter antarcticus]|uniref:GNAT family N-acetyltransferase n=1 Tax=Novilysobacter antarcticus TaxID=2862543 RepID=UPI001C99E955|nr:GNAT family N-acetyltransferase [Lysobacter antarcticus]